MKAFPLFITVTDRTVVVFGGGEEAAAKLRLLLKTEASVVAVAEHFEPAVADLRGLSLIEQAPLTYDLPTGVPFVYAATGDEALDAQIAQRVRAKNVLVCAADQPAVSDFSTPAIVDRDPVVVAIGTEGTAPVLARNIKAQIEFILEPSLGLIARAAAGLRKTVAETLAPGAPRRTFWHAFFGAARAQGNPSQDGLTRLGHSLINEQTAPSSKGSIIFVGTGTGKVEDLTIGAHKAIDEADVVLADPLVDRAVLELARREAVQTTLSLGQTAPIVEHLRQGHRVVRLVSGSGALAQDELDRLNAAGLTPKLLRGVDAEFTQAPAHQRAARNTFSLFNRKAA